MDYSTDLTIDAKGQKCPMPVLLASRGIKKIESGQVMLIEATDGGAKSDIPSWAKDTGNELLETSNADGIFRFVIRKK
ncbi:MAG: sulfurtransferase TusA family protein [Nocardioides sp.]|jgi:tRNA 2-thiouridine synthesizing protein A|nr:sulfurtransferase TusA family protein [Nocardioides sp.]